MGEEGHVMLLLAGDLGCDLRAGRTFRTPQYGDLSIINPKPYSIYLTGTINPEPSLSFEVVGHVQACRFEGTN